jgi:hypothetical protein
LRETADGAACVNATSSSSVSPCVQCGVTRRPSTRCTITSWLCTSASRERECLLEPVAPNDAPSVELALEVAAKAMS